MNKISSLVKKKTQNKNGRIVPGGFIETRGKIRSIPKAGMVGSLGTLIASSIVRFKGAKTLHVWSGVALVGFSLWHYLQNRPRTKKSGSYPDKLG